MWMKFYLCGGISTMVLKMMKYQGRIQDFKVGGGAHLKQIAPSGGKGENFWGNSFEKSRFYAKKSYFFRFYGGRT